MARPQKCRFVSALPGVLFFKPAGIPMAKLEEVPLTVDEFEAIRWAHIENLQHGDAAEKMGVSRPTFTRILARAHRKVATALVNGQALRINGGNYQLAQMRQERVSNAKSKRKRQNERA